MRTLYLLYFFLPSLMLLAQESSLLPKWEAALRYGIDTEAISTVEELTEGREETLADVVLERMRSSDHVPLLVKGFDYFLALERNDALIDAEQVLRNFNRYNTNLLYKALQYVETFADAGMIPVLEPLLDSEEVRAQVVLTVGKLGDLEDAVLLESWFSKTRDTRTRGNILLALADIASPDSASFLVDVIERPGLSSEITRYAIYALAVCGSGRDEIYEKIEPFLESNDQWIRMYAVSSFAYFDHEAIPELLLDALRDEFWKVRVEAVKLAAAQEFHHLLPALVYKMEHDPAIDVRIQSAEVLAGWDSAESWEAIYRLLEDRKVPPQVRAELLVHALTIRPAERREQIRSLIDAELGSRSQLIARLVQFLGDASSGDYSDIAELLLISADPGVVIGSLRYIGEHRIATLKERVTPFLDSAYPAVAHYAEQALSKIGD